MKFSARDTLESGIHDAPLTVTHNVELFDAFAVQLVYGAGSVASAAELQASCDYDEETGTGNWATVLNSDETLDHAAGGIHIWNVREFMSPFLKIVITGDVTALEITFIGQPNQNRLPPG